MQGELKAGETIRAVISRSLTYEVTHEGWTLKVSSTQPLAVRPNADGSVEIICVGDISGDFVEE